MRSGNLLVNDMVKIMYQMSLVYLKRNQKMHRKAHEAIRPTTVRHIPSEIKSSLDADQFKLYELIWKRTVASQMTHATIDTVAVDMDCGRR